MRPALMRSVREALDRPWVLDIDASIKPLYGRQEGAELGYNPGKPGRPSPVLHTFWVGNLRLVLDVQVSSGKQHTSVHAKAALGRLLDDLGDKRPALARGDSGYGNEGILLELESRDPPYLLRLRQTANVQRLVAWRFARQDWSRPDNQGCPMIEDELQLHGWSKKRRVVVVRQRIKGGIARERRVNGKQLKLDLAGQSVHEGERLWAYAVMVTDVKYPVEAIGQLYRDRADCRVCKVRGFDELKSQWGLSGFTKQDINRCQTTLYLTPLHGKANMLRPLIANIHAALQHVKAAAEQFKTADRWALLLRYISNKIVPTLGPVRPPNALPATG